MLGFENSLGRLYAPGSGSLSKLSSIHKHCNEIGRGPTVLTNNGDGSAGSDPEGEAFVGESGLQIVANLMVSKHVVDE